MARLHEHQGKALLQQFGIAVPRGELAHTPQEARAAAERVGGAVAVKAQIWTTKRAALGAIRFAETPAEAEQAASALLGMQVGGYAVEAVLVEEKLAIAREFYAGVIVDDRARAPVIIFSSRGGSGIEEIAAEHPEAVAQQVIDIRWGLRDFEARDLVRRAGVHGKLLLRLGNVLPRLYALARAYDARAAEVNPLVLTEAGELVAADCRVTVDDNAVYRHPELGITIAREFDRPPTRLERIAWEVERDDYRGTFYFIQLERDFKRGERVIGFHGAGGGGSMMSMDAALAQGFRLANFVDTSGNPPASKVYRAARIVLSQEGIDGYFASGSGVASQEQYRSARGLVKAFMEAPLTVPAVVRLGGNGEERALDILRRAQPHIPAPVEGYGKDDPPEKCAARLRELVETWQPPTDPPRRQPPKPAEPYSFRTVSGGRVVFDHAICRTCENQVCVQQCDPQILRLEGGVPVLAIAEEEAARGRCSECLACDVECALSGAGGGYVFLPIPELDE